MKPSYYIVLDVEATCYNRDYAEVQPVGFKNEIIEIGAYCINFNNKIIDSFSKFLRPKLFPQLSTFCKDLTSIRQYDIDTAEPADIVLQEFIDWSGVEQEEPNDVVFVSWGFYDKNQFQSDFLINNFKNINIINDKNHISLKHKHAEWNSIKPVGLGKACKMEKINFEGIAHRGIDDARNIVKIFQKYLYKL